MAPKVPTRTDAFVECDCGAVAKITTVAPIADAPAHMRHIYHCADCGSDLNFDVAKKPQGIG